MIVTFNGTQIDVEKVLTFSVDGNKLVMHTPDDNQALDLKTDSKEIMNTVAEYARLCCENNFKNIDLDKLQYWLFNQNTNNRISA